MTAIEPKSIATEVIEERRNGRPSKYSREAVATILRGLRRGFPVTLACEAGGICVATFNLWRRKYGKFDGSVRRALVTGISRRLKRIETASESGDWRASAWLLEHTQAEHFARSRVEVSGPDGTPLLGMVTLYLPQKGSTPNGGGSFIEQPKELENGRH